MAARVRALSWPRPELTFLLVAAAVLYLWALDRNGMSNEYYSGAVRSMSSSWHAFLYGSFDSAGVMTVDKPPLALWIQALAARALGFGSWSMLVPQALMGVAAVGLSYDLVRRRFGRPAAFAAGLTLVLTPVTVALSRHNNPDALLALCSVAALWALVRGLEDGRTRWLVLSGVFVGLGFEAKMAAALLVVPGIAAAWLWVAPRGRVKALGQLLAGGAAMLAVGCVWPLFVALTPASDRPWISGTSDNSVWSLIFGYNGLGRLLGQDGGPGGGPGGGVGGRGGAFGGDAGPLRLLNQSLGGQAGWLLGFALIGAIALTVVTKLRRNDARTGWLIAVGGAFAVTVVAFSQAQGIFHPYYVVQLAPFVAMLVGATVGLVHQGGKTARIVGPAALAAGVVTELWVIATSDSMSWLVPLLVLGALAAGTTLARGGSRRVRTAALIAAMGVLLVAPGAWAVQTVGHSVSGTFPAGGPSSAAMAGMPGGGPGGGAPGGAPPSRAAPGGAPPTGAAPNSGPPAAGAPGTGVPGGPPPGAMTGAAGSPAAPPSGGGPGGPGNSQATREAVAYAKQHGGGTVAVSGQNGADRLVSSGADVAAIGGFSGRESQVSAEWLAHAVERGQIRWVLTEGSGGGMPQDDRVGSSDLMASLEKVGTPVDGVDGLYDLEGKADAIRAAG
ncbi:MAG TPA: glycosyltransferase family 39 protein [Thermoleophilaceae bacterium]|nr:glycosyltransferase family 39 protein [Thermoleophilaceae bacterium]